MGLGKAQDTEQKLVVWFGFGGVSWEGFGGMWGERADYAFKEVTLHWDC